MADAPSTSFEYEASDDILVNPERGFYTTTNLATVRDLAYVRSVGKSLVYAAVHLDAYLGANHEADLPKQVFDDIQAGFDAVRRAHLKAIVRFQYDDGEGYPSGANDAPEHWMIRHLEQLTPVLRANEDVLFLLQAGFIGAWGEWHTSKNFTDGVGSAESRKRVLNALLQALPKSRRTALRYPAYKRMFFGPAGTTYTELQALNDSARVSHLNDCFVSGDDDVGTYQYEPMATLKDYLAADTQYVPIGGETCAAHARNSCATTTAEMKRFHWTYINDDYHPDVLKVWQDQGCRPDIERSLGYRIVLTGAAFASAVRPGGSFVLDLELENTGFAAFTNARRLHVVLEGQAGRHVVALEADPRSWLPGSSRITARLRLPTNISPGAYRLALWLPDAESSLQSIADYSVQLANRGVWNAASGDNTLGQISISDDASGDVDLVAPSFAVIP